MPTQCVFRHEILTNFRLGGFVLFHAERKTYRSGMESVWFVKLVVNAQIEDNNTFENMIFWYCNYRSLYFIQKFMADCLLHLSRKYLNILPHL